MLKDRRLRIVEILSLRLIFVYVYVSIKNDRAAYKLAFIWWIILPLTQIWLDSVLSHDHNWSRLQTTIYFFDWLSRGVGITSDIWSDAYWFTFLLLCKSNIKVDPGNLIQYNSIRWVTWNKNYRGKGKDIRKPWNLGDPQRFIMRMYGWAGFNLRGHWLTVSAQAFLGCCWSFSIQILDDFHHPRLKGNQRIAIICSLYNRQTLQLLTALACELSASERKCF